ncbi:choline transporter-like 1 isoform X2 [Episyrphus balteatus]|uniref:choline transporter-like 1 isoform X2 n=1 Tax=Episyrphus balteatus TaxID=286459 RepID=UPI00248557AA|nr:choline transporter-like 1 isoform X2 [Episyrphus balteatus]
MVSIIIIVFSIDNGYYTTIINGVDSYGNICNRTHNKHFENFTLSGWDTSQKPYLFYFDIKNFAGVLKICVENCPFGELYNIEDILLYKEQYSTQLCSYDVNVLKEAMLVINENENINDIMRRMGPCPAVTTRSIHFKNRCLPDKQRLEVLQESYDLLNAGGLDQIFFISVYQSWKYVATLCGFAFGISLILLVLMFWLSKILPWLICFVTIIANTTLFIEFWSNYNKFPFVKKTGEEYEDDTPPKILFKNEFGINFYEMFDRILWDLLDEVQFNNDIILYLTFFTLIVNTILIALIFEWMIHLNQLKLLFDEAAACVKNLPGLIIAQIIGLLCMSLLIFLSGYTLLCIVTSKTPVTSPLIDEYYTNDKGGSFIDRYTDQRLFQQIEYVDMKAIRQTFWIFIIGMLWTTEFIFAFEEFCIGAAVGFWYFTPSINNPSLHAFRVLLKYHLGSIVKASAIIALVKIPKLLWTSIFKKFNQKLNLFWIQRLQYFDDQIQIWNHKAYVPAAMETTCFRSAGEVAWKIFSKNSKKMQDINNVFGFVLFLSKYFVAILTCFVGIKLLKDRKDYLFNEDRHEYFFYMAPVLFSTLCAFCIAHIVFSIFEMTVDALLLCACEDQQINGRLKRFIKKSNLIEIFPKIRGNSIEKFNG